ncbi:MAG: DUF1353 domain-containing protein [Rhodobacterales bacterium]|nr:DUF1353 domain-containing protein [Rhodobacterales bacterium]
MFWTPQCVRPATLEVARGLVLHPSEVEETGSLRQGRPEYRILRSLWYRDFTVPAGFVFDIHSLPRPLRLWQPKHPQWWGPAAIHDWALESGLVSLREANLLYKGAMQDLGVKWVHREVAYAGVEFARHAFPDRITQIDPDNADLVAELAGREAVYRERGATIRKALFMAAKMALTGYARSKGVMLP